MATKKVKWGSPQPIVSLKIHGVCSCFASGFGFFENQSGYVFQVVLELLGSNNPPVSAFQVPQSQVGH